MYSIVKPLNLIYIQHTTTLSGICDKQLVSLQNNLFNRYQLNRFRKHIEKTYNMHGRCFKTSLTYATVQLVHV